MEGERGGRERGPKVEEIRGVIEEKTETNSNFGHTFFRGDKRWKNRHPHIGIVGTEKC